MLRTSMSACDASAGVRVLSACLLAALVCIPSRATAQSSAGGPSSTLFSNLANPAIGMNALFTGQAWAGKPGACSMSTPSYPVYTVGSELPASNFAAGSVDIAP